VVTEELMSTSAGGGSGGGGGGVCAWRRWFGECGGLEKDGGEGCCCCWLKCSGCSTLTLMAGEWKGGACEGETQRADGRGRLLPRQGEGKQMRRGWIGERRICTRLHV
jgi:hypothetical protein